MSERLCYDCKHCLCDYDPDWSDITPGLGLTLECTKGVWSFGRDLTRENLRESMRKALHCPMFEPVELPSAGEGKA